MLSQMVISSTSPGAITCVRAPPLAGSPVQLPLAGLRPVGKLCQKGAVNGIDGEIGNLALCYGDDLALDSCATRQLFATRKRHHGREHEAEAP